MKSLIASFCLKVIKDLFVLDFPQMIPCAHARIADSVFVSIPVWICTEYMSVANIHSIIGLRNTYCRIQCVVVASGWLKLLNICDFRRLPVSSIRKMKTTHQLHIKSGRVYSHNDKI